MIGRTLNKILSLPLLGLIWVYSHVISPLIGANCRFQPSCSSYAKEALLLHGVIRGSWLALKRIGRCHPWGGFGYDPVPEPERRADETN